jgi:hypothetical protein
MQSILHHLSCNQGFLSAVCSQSGGGAEEDTPLWWPDQPGWARNWEEPAQRVGSAVRLVAIEWDNLMYFTEKAWFRGGEALHKCEVNRIVKYIP